MLRVVHFEINAEEPERAVRFYQEIFGWEIVKWDGPVDYWIVNTGDETSPGINGGVVKRRNSSASFVNIIEVPDIEHYLKKIEEAGGEVVQQKTVIHGLGWMAYCRDPEGNLFGLIQNE